MNEIEYKNKLFQIIKGHDKSTRGIKYIRKWDYYWTEKQFVLESKFYFTNLELIIYRFNLEFIQF